ncbi:hypothetical protein KQX54_000492 [Cotesia glomerata]|uniref:Uncharacterized protein n=1 Tax=Cotesia glomerata TaxID=32391 RepID=A0AAV7IM97_COTGL|nr:hypothetical protein KQX54_000492 [Cotesia glomerata]
MEKLKQEATNESSRAVVSGTNGMGQAQSMTAGGSCSEDRPGLQKFPPVPAAGYTGLPGVRWEQDFDCSRNFAGNKWSRCWLLSGYFNCSGNDRNFPANWRCIAGERTQELVCREPGREFQELLSGGVVPPGGQITWSDIQEPFQVANDQGWDNLVVNQPRTYPGGVIPGVGQPGTYPGSIVPGIRQPGSYPGSKFQGLVNQELYPGVGQPGTYPGGSAPGSGQPGTYPGGISGVGQLGTYPGGSVPGTSQPGTYPGGMPGSRGQPGTYPGGSVPGTCPEVLLRNLSWSRDNHELVQVVVFQGTYPGGSVPGTSQSGTYPGVSVPGTSQPGTYPGGIQGIGDSLESTQVVAFPELVNQEPGPGGTPGVGTNQELWSRWCMPGSGTAPELTQVVCSAYLFRWNSGGWTTVNISWKLYQDLVPELYLELDKSGTYPGGSTIIPGPQGGVTLAQVAP